jgi:autotransporter-associated beta strand protein
MPARASCSPPAAVPPTCGSITAHRHLNVALNGTGSIAKYDTGTLVLNAANGYSGGTALNGGTLVVGNNSALGSGVLTAAAGTTLDSNTAVTLANNAVLNGALAIGGSNAWNSTATSAARAA